VAHLAAGARRSGPWGPRSSNDKPTDRERNLQMGFQLRPLSGRAYGFGERCVTGIISFGFLAALVSWPLGSAGGSSSALPSAAAPSELAGLRFSRGDLWNSAEVRYTRYDFVVPGDSFEDLALIISQSHALPSTGLGFAVIDWLDQRMPYERLATVGRCAVDGVKWVEESEVLQRVRLDEQAAEALALQSGARWEPPPRRISRFFDGSDSWTVTDGRFVTIESGPSEISPIAQIDPSLLNWSWLGSPPPGAASPDWHRADGVCTLSASKAVGGGTYVEQVRFDELRSMAPLDHSLQFGDTLLARTVCGYAPGSGTEFPAVTLKGRSRGDGTVETTVWVVHVACASADSSLVAVRVPPLFLQVDYREGGADIAAVKEPEVLSVVPVCAKPTAAVMLALEVFGTVDESADFDFDGVVGASDVVRVLERF
jgi:hypothetical protein